MATVKKREDGKYMIQVLLPPNRGKLYADYIESNDLQASSHLKELVFQFLETIHTAEECEAVKLEDQKNWRQIVERRVQGKENARKQRESKKL
tara:strand:- start:838 stop:1116 length:279 start_codon:yes stop_codon:yes gene_type:complete